MPRWLRLLFALAALAVFLLLLRTCAPMEAEQSALQPREGAPLGLADAAATETAGRAGVRVPASVPRAPVAQASLAAMERVTEALQPGLRIALRAVDEERRPLRNAELEFTLLGVGWNTDPLSIGGKGWPVTTDRDGRIEIGGLLGMESGPRQFVILQQGQPPLPWPHPRSGALEIVRAFQPDVVNELGDCVLRLEPVLVAGRVVDEGGRGLGGALLSVSFPGQGGARHLARAYMQARPVVDADGSFEVRSRRRPREVQVSARVPGRHLAEVRGLEPGASDVELVLALTHLGRIEGRARFDIGVPPASLGLQVRARAGGALRRTWLDGDGRFLLEDVEPGMVDLEVVTRTARKPLHRIDRLEVVADAACTDPRLDTIDLRGRIALMRLKFEGPDGLPLAKRGVLVRDSIAAVGGGRTDDEGRFALLVPTDEGLWTLKVERFAEVAVGLLADEQVLRLTW